MKFYSNTPLDLVLFAYWNINTALFGQHIQHKVCIINTLAKHPCGNKCSLSFPVTSIVLNYSWEIDYWCKRMKWLHFCHIGLTWRE